ncbi:hypothetical protein HBB16_00940 [Pseudonocardia sp. MCCB 268]|nr:hypothetical protein [Pseudonocardia cytotoxica]
MPLGNCSTSTTSRPLRSRRPVDLRVHRRAMTIVGGLGSTANALWRSGRRAAGTPAAVSLDGVLTLTLNRQVRALATPPSTKLVAALDDARPSRACARSCSAGPTARSARWGHPPDGHPHRRRRRAAAARYRRLIDSLVEIEAGDRGRRGHAAGAGSRSRWPATSSSPPGQPTSGSRSSPRPGPDTPRPGSLTRQIGAPDQELPSPAGRWRYRARELGIAQEVWPDDEFDDRLSDYAGRIASGRRHAGHRKRIVQRAADCDLAAVWDLESSAPRSPPPPTTTARRSPPWREKRTPRSTATERKDAHDDVHPHQP